MSLVSEIIALRTLMPFMEGEELVVARLGTVNGPNIANREGILFATTMRLGVSVEAGFFSDAAIYWRSNANLHQIWEAGQTIQISFQAESTYALTYEENDEDITDEDTLDTVAVIRSLAAQVVRCDLEPTAAEMRQKRESGDTKAAERLASQLLRQQPECIEAIFVIALALQSRGEHEDAIIEFRRILEIGPAEPAEIQFLIACAMLEAGRIDDAEGAATEILDAFPLAAPVLVLRARARTIRGNAASAMSDARRAIELDPALTDAWHLLALHSLDLRDTVELGRSIVALEELDAQAQVAVLRPRLLLLQGNFQGALDAALDALRTHPEDSWLANTLLEASVEIGSASALSWIPRFDKIHAGNDEYQLWSSFALLQNGQPSAAFDRFKTLATATSHTWGRRLLAVLEASSLVEKHQPREAVATAQAALAEAPPSEGSNEDHERVTALLHYVAGKALVESCMFLEALPHFREVESRLSQNDSSLRWIARDFAQLLELALQGSAKISYDNLVPHASNRAGIFETLRVLSEALEASGRHREQARRVLEDRARFDEPPLVAVMGEYSVGKSSFINALICRDDLLPTGDGVTTGTITILRYGEPERMRAVFRSGRIIETDSLQPVDRFVRETDDAERQDLHHVDVFVKADVLRRISVVDSPGLNAPFPEHKAITEGFLAESDAICFLFNVESMGKSGEAAFLGKLHEHRRKAIGVVNQIDQVTAADAKEVVEAVDTDFPATFTTVFGVSAKRALEGLRRADPALRERSGMTALESWMESNLLASARQIKVDALRARSKGVVEEVRIARGAFDVEVETLLKALQERRSALLRWTGDQLRSLLHDELARLRSNVDRTISEIAETTAARSTPTQSPPVAFFDQQSRLLVEASKAVRDGLLKRLLDSYHAEVGGLLSFLRVVRSTEWHESMREGLMQVQMECDSWAKDLADYLEQPVAFLDGFIEARGLASVVHVDVADGSRNRADVVRAAMAPRLAFLHERIGLAAQRWASELRSNFEESLSRLERQLRTEAARVREHSFRRIEALEVLFTEPPTRLSLRSESQIAS